MSDSIHVPGDENLAEHTGEREASEHTVNSTWSLALRKAPEVMLQPGTERGAAGCELSLISSHWALHTALPGIRSQVRPR